MRSLLDYRLVVVSGKGGVGKTAIACALAEAARQAGRRVLLVETAALECAAACFESEPRPVAHAGRELAPGLRALRIDPHEALAEYVQIQLRLGRLADLAVRSELFRQLLEAAPAWRELIVLGKIWHLEQRRSESGRPLFDLIVVDAPATGHGLTFLDVPRAVQHAIRTGPLARHASWVEALVRDRERTLLLPVTLPEELPVQETVELVARARREIGIAVDRIVVNAMPSGKAQAALQTLGTLADEPSLEALPSVAAMRTLLADEDRRARSARRFAASIAERCDLPLVEFPLLAAGFEAGSGWATQATRLLASPHRPQPVHEAANAIAGSNHCDRSRDDATHESEAT